MKPLPILDLFVLSMLDRDLTCLYELQRRAGLSLGATTPALKRLTKLELVTQSTDRSSGKRKKYQLALTPAGRKHVRAAWPKLLASLPPADLDSALRIVDMALHYGAKSSEIAEFLNNAAGARTFRSRQTGFIASDASGAAVSKYPQLRSECDAASLEAEGTALRAIAKRLNKRSTGRRSRRDVIFIQESLEVPKP